jgi:branched-chain amino acid transport system ATP-binding protein
MSTQKPLLQINNLSVNYGAVQALREASLVVNSGEVVALIGANGAGKSSLLRAISRIISTKHGNMVYDGKELTKLRPDVVVREGIAHVPEGRRILTRLSVEDNLLLGAYTRNDPKIKDDVEKQYQRFPRLGERRKQLAGTLSGGEQQMLAISRALMSHPRLLLLDEPSLGLAPLIVKDIFKIIDQLHEQGVTILIVEQNAQLALSHADRGYVLEAGSIVFTGEAKQLIHDERVKKAYLG